MTVISIDLIKPNPDQPRKHFDQAGLQDLAESIKANGLIQPVVVEDLGSDHFQLIDGERRWRAAKLAGLQEIEAVIRPGMNGGGEQERLVLALVANLQRENLNPIEIANSYKEMTDMGMTHAEIARMVGQSQPNITLYLGFLDLEPEIQELYRQKKLPVDAVMFYKLRQLPEDYRVKMARRFAELGYSGKQIVKSCARLLHKLENAAPKEEIVPRAWPPETKTFPKQDHEFPAARLIHTRLPKASWDPKLAKAAELTCKACPFADLEDLMVCKDCPLPDLLKRLVVVEG